MPRSTFAALDEAAEHYFDLVQRNLETTEKKMASPFRQPVFQNNGKRNWPQLKKGMAMETVLDLLGEPDAADGSSDNQIIWSYPNGGQVSIIGGIVSTWTEPH